MDISINITLIARIKEISERKKDTKHLINKIWGDEFISANSKKSSEIVLYIKSQFMSLIDMLDMWL